MRKEDLDEEYESEEYEDMDDEYGDDTEPARRKLSGRNHFFSGWMGLFIGIIIGAVAIAAVFAITTMRSQATTSMDLDYETKIEYIVSYLKAYYLNDLEDEDIETALAKGLLENIGDKYATYYTPEEFQEQIASVNGTYAGIGVRIVKNDDGYIEVYEVFDGSPAQEAGIHVKDLIVEADGQRDFETMDELVAIVTGEEGTTVDIVVERDGEEIPMTVERRAIETESVYSTMMDDTVGYIQITTFNTASVQQFNDAIDSLLEEGMTSVIIDLRNNPGGDYDSVVSMIDRVVPEGPIVSTENKQGGITTENSDAECLDIPIVLLVNENTASAAELFTMALHDYGMAEIVGTTTYGKGIVQSIYQLPDGSGLKFTTEKYYGPAGNCIQDVGITPDYEVELPEDTYKDGIIYEYEDTQLQKAAELLGSTYDFTQNMPETTSAEDVTNDSAEAEDSADDTAETETEAAPETEIESEETVE